MLILELFSGIGAVSVACRNWKEVVCAVDINQSAMEVYRANFDSPTLLQEIASLSDRQLAELRADIWWLSPPCQPFTRRGLKRDHTDKRTKPLLRLITAIKTIRPANIALENVVGFENSATFEYLAATLEAADYQIATTRLCSTDFGLPNLRPRFFLAASRGDEPNLQPIFARRQQRKLSEFLDTEPDLVRWRNDLAVDGKLIENYRQAINVVTPDSCSSRCFTSAYGHSLVRSGSYLQTGDRWRRFSPSEMCRLLGFPPGFRLPTEQLSTQQLWKLIGNSVSIPCARYVLAAFKPRLA